MEKVKNFDVRKFRIAVIKMAITACTIVTMVCSAAMIAYAANDENAAPTGVGGKNTQQKLIEVVFWIVRGAIVIIGGAPALIKIVQGQSDENPRDRNAGIATAVITGACFGATFLVQSLI